MSIGWEQVAGIDLPRAAKAESNEVVQETWHKLVEKVQES